MFKYLIEKLVDGINKMESHKNLKDKDQLMKDFKLPKAHSKTRIISINVITIRTSIKTYLGRLLHFVQCSEQPRKLTRYFQENGSTCQG